MSSVARPALDAHAPPVVSHAEWLLARRALLAIESDVSRRRDELAAERRRLPMVRVAREYAFVGPRGTATLRDLFGPHRQLLVHHFAFAPGWDEGCPSCALLLDALDGSLPHLAARDTAFACVSRAPADRLQAYRARMAWDVDWYSSGGSRFDRDFHVALDDAARGLTLAPSRTPPHAMSEMDEASDARGESHGMSAFLRDGDAIYHTYAARQSVLADLVAAFNLLDLTPSGRGEPDAPTTWIRHRDRYDV